MFVLLFYVYIKRKEVRFGCLGNEASYYYEE